MVVFFTAVVCAGASEPKPPPDGPTLWKTIGCVMCHGEGGKADTKMGQVFSISDMTTKAWQKKISDAQIKQTITKGLEREKNGRKVKMKAYDKLEPQEVDALLRHIRSFAPREG